MEAGHHHRQREPVDLKVRRERSCGGGLGLGHCAHPNWLDSDAELKLCPIQSGRVPQSSNNASGTSIRHDSSRKAKDIIEIARHNWHYLKSDFVESEGKILPCHSISPISASFAT